MTSHPPFPATAVRLLARSPDYGTVRMVWGDMQWCSRQRERLIVQFRHITPPQWVDLDNLLLKHRFTNIQDPSHD